MNIKYLEEQNCVEAKFSTPCMACYQLNSRKQFSLSLSLREVTGAITKLLKSKSLSLEKFWSYRYRSQGEIIELPPLVPCDLWSCLRLYLDGSHVWMVYESKCKCFLITMMTIYVYSFPIYLIRYHILSSIAARSEKIYSWRRKSYFDLNWKHSRFVCFLFSASHFLPPLGNKISYLIFFQRRGTEGSLFVLSCCRNRWPLARLP